MMADRTHKRDQLALKVGDRFLLVQAEDVIYASVNGDTIVVATAQLSGTSNYRTLDELQARLDAELFWRVHRSHLVNISKIKEIVPWFSRNYILRMRDAKGTEIPVSRSQTKRLRDYLMAFGHGADLDGPLFRPVRRNAAGQLSRRHLAPDAVDRNGASRPPRRSRPGHGSPCRSGVRKPNSSPTCAAAWRAPSATWPI
jgi:hypothetical protein